MTHMAVMRRLGEVPLVLNLCRHLDERLEFLPRIAAVLAAIEMNRFSSGIDHSIIGRVDRDPANVALERPLPVFAGIFSAIQTVESHPGKNNLGRALAAV